MTLAQASRCDGSEFEIVFDNLIGWTLANVTLVTVQRECELATFADPAGLVESMTPDLTLAPASYCELGLGTRL